MKKLLNTSLFLFLTVIIVQANDDKSVLTANFITGDPGIESISAITFGPQGILFLGDSQGAAIIAIDTKDTKPIDGGKEVQMDNID